MTTYLGRIAFDLFCESIGAQAEWDDCCSSSQKAWNDAANELLLKMVVSPEFYSLLKTEINAIRSDLFQSNLPVLQSRDFLYKQINTLANELQTERQLVEDQRSLFRQKMEECKIPDDDDTPIDKKWMQQFFFSLYVKIPSGREIEFDTWGHEWFAWILPLLGAAFQERQRLCVLKTRGDLRRLLKCLGVTDWEETEDYE